MLIQGYQLKHHHDVLLNTVLVEGHLDEDSLLIAEEHRLLVEVFEGPFFFVLFGAPLRGDSA